MSDDPFDAAVDDGGYDIDKFYTAHGDRASESVVQQIKFDPVMLDLLYKLFIVPEEYGDYKSLSDFVADAVHHRRNYLLKNARRPVEPTVLRQIAAWESRATSKRVSSRLEARRDAVDKVINGIARCSDAKQRGDPEALREFLKEGWELRPKVSNDAERARLITALVAGEQVMDELQMHGQQKLTAALEFEEEATMFDPFDVVRDNE